MTAFQLIKPATAFSMTGGKKRPRKEDRKYLEQVRSLPCVVTGRRPVEAAHIRAAAPRWGKRDVGGQEKPDDRWTLPLHADLHREQHTMPELLFWKKYGIDPFAVAAALWGARDDDDAMELIVKSARAKP